MAITGVGRKFVKFVHVVDEVPGLEPGRSLPLVLALHGFLDAGNAAVVAVDHLSSHGTGPVVATFDVDVFHDYRARRPVISFVRDHYEEYDAPRLVVRLMHDEVDQPYLLLSGPEPDTRWEGFAEAVRAVVERFNVDLVVALGSVPMAAPHSRPLAVTQHANRTDLMLRRNPWLGEMRVPASAQALVEVRLKEHSHDMTGYVAHVPHYLSQFDHPLAALRLLEGVEESSGLSFHLDALKVAAEAKDREIATYLKENPEVGEIVEGLEQQYDAFARSEEAGRSLLAEDGEIPTGDEIGEQFEQFLAGLDGPDTTP